ncbi:ribonucleotide-diphosphate reductase subunit beta [Maricurvus nonylphenolicus]|uniref:ribonucleotide-diphosphate reductase subunit beta n=1 Tax=Maricurvus nonylphenolicus TaxID=1008307 RepID=UPI0036F3C41C
MLSWDEYSEEEVALAPVVSSAPAAEAPKVEAPQQVQNPAPAAPVAAEPAMDSVPPAVDVFNDVDLNAEELAAGLADLKMTGTRVRAEDKRIINGNSDVNQVVPIKYDWAWQKYLDGSQNHWMPQEINMAKDVAMWKSQDGLSDDERRIVKMGLGYFSTADTVVANNLLLSIYKHITAPEARFYIGLQFREELIHAHSYQYCIESMGMDESEIWNLYQEQPSVARKAAWSLKHTETINRPEFTTGTKEADTEFLKNLISYYVGAEGIFFYCGFTAILSMGRQNKMTGVAEQFQYILRDESMHLNFGIDLINQIKLESPELWDAEMQETARKMIAEAVMLESEFARDMMPRGVLGMNSTMMIEYLKFIGNRRLAQIGLAEMWPGIQNPFPWMSEIMDLRKEKNFFETKVTEYQQSGALSWD